MIETRKIGPVGGPFDRQGLYGSDLYSFGTYGPGSEMTWKDARLGWGFMPGTSLQRNEGALPTGHGVG